MKTLKEIYPDVPSNLSKLLIENLVFNSRQVGPGDLFFAIQGTEVDGHDFIEQAIEAGASAVVCQKIPLKSEYSKFILVENSRRVLSEMAAAFFDFPSKKLGMIGITGTSGKTTTSFLIESILNSTNLKIALMGTIYGKFGNIKFNVSHTTPDPVELQKKLMEIQNEKGDWVVMEVSSHAIEQYRVRGVFYDILVFTNLSSEHLDYHENLEKYYQAKRKLFFNEARLGLASGKKIKAVINDKNNYGARLAKEIQDSGISLELQLFSQAKVISEFGWNGVKAEIEIENKKYKIESMLIGEFNLENILASVLVAHSLKLDSKVIETGVKKLKGVPGRMERVGNSQEPVVLVDYAHKPDALEKVLQNLKKLKKANQKIITLFGCGGDRDRGKRPQMGKIASKYSDIVWVTSDNPRTENPELIIEEIKGGIAGGCELHIEADRTKAIRDVILQMSANDILLIAGKGHEDYQIVGHEKRPLDDRLISKAALSSRID